MHLPRFPVCRAKETLQNSDFCVVDESLAGENIAMKQAAFYLSTWLKKTRKRELLEQMVLTGELVALIAPYCLERKIGTPPFSLMIMLRVHFVQQWVTLSDTGMVEVFFDTPLYREFAQLKEFARLPNESSILRIGKTSSPSHRLDKHKLAEKILAIVNELLTQRRMLLKAGTAVDATLIPASCLTKNKDRARDPEMHSSKKGNQWYSGKKAYIGVDADSGLVHTMRGTSDHASDIAEGSTFLLGQETVAFGNAGYRGIDKRCDANPGVTWHVAMRPGKRRALSKKNEADAMIDQAERLKAGIRAKVEHPFRVLKRQIGFVKVLYRGLKKNTVRLFTLFELSNLWMVPNTVA